MKTGAIFLDRDGTLNPDPGYISSPDDFELYGDTFPALEQLTKTGLSLILITNQSGIGRGIIQESALARIHEKLDRSLLECGIVLSGKYYCPHVPKDRCGCRKPETGLFKEAEADHEINLSSSYLIGDSLCDVNAARAIGAHSILVRTGNGRGTEAELNRDGGMVDFVGDTLMDCSNHILGLEAVE
ncbi:MAG: HAD family hydrolase [Candidatus Neomarinimicrobiota bacterium]|nr:HAD family hydrolase [Candidatus Neomarinimicrobiota bacterium]